MTDHKKLVIWGGTGHARVLADAVSGRASIGAVFDRREVDDPIAGVETRVGWDGFAEWRREHPESDWFFAIAIGGHGGADRLEIDERLREAGLTPLTIRHPFSYVAQGATCGAGSQVLAGAVIGANARLGRQTVINTKASVDHDCVVGDGVHIAPGATVCGEVVIGDSAFVATGATILPRLKIGSNAVVGAGAVVTRDVADDTRVLGVPARVQNLKRAL